MIFFIMKSIYVGDLRAEIKFLHFIQMGEIPAIAANSTATAVAAEAAAEVEATAADTKSGPRSGISVLSLITRLLSTNVIAIYYDLLFFFSFAQFLIHTTLNILVPLNHYLPMFTET